MKREEGKHEYEKCWGPLVMVFSLSVSLSKECVQNYSLPLLQIVKKYSFSTKPVLALCH